MTAAGPREIPFQGVRLRFECTKSFDEVLKAPLSDIDEHPLRLDTMSAKFGTWESHRAEVEIHVGPSGFIRFATFNHGAWLNKPGIRRKVLRLILENPVLASAMLRHDQTAGLFAPVELLLMEEDGNRCSLTGVSPSSLMFVEDTPPFLASARELDEKFQDLADQMTKAYTGLVAGLSQASTAA